MTTIVITPRLIIGDTQMNDGGLKFTSKKVHLMGDRIIGFAGEFHEGMRFVIGEESQADPKDSSTYTEVVYLTPHGHMWIWNNFQKMHSRILDMPFWAIGTGAMAAMGAMKAGATPIEAIEIAGEIDVETNSKPFGIEIEAFN